jgi:hypothetical protein
LTATFGQLAGTVSERGSLEVSRVDTVSCQVEGGSIIIKIVSDGMLVKKGELDSSGVKDQLINQTVVRKRAEAAYQDARLAREVAEIAVVEHDQGIYPQDPKTLRDQIATAQSADQKAEARLHRVRAALQRLNDVMRGRGEAATPADIVAQLDVGDRLEAAEEAVERERKSLELAQNKLQILEKYTHAKRLKELRSEVEKARRRAGQASGLGAGEAPGSEAPQPDPDWNPAGQPVKVYSTLVQIDKATPYTSARGGPPRVRSWSRSAATCSACRSRRCSIRTARHSSRSRNRMAGSNGARSSWAWPTARWSRSGKGTSMPASGCCSIRMP